MNPFAQLAARELARRASNRPVIFVDSSPAGKVAHEHRVSRVLEEQARQAFNKTTGKEL